VATLSSWKYRFVSDSDYDRWIKRIRWAATKLQEVMSTEVVGQAFDVCANADTRSRTDVHSSGVCGGRDRGNHASSFAHIQEVANLRAVSQWNRNAIFQMASHCWSQPARMLSFAEKIEEAAPDE
jgi:hypothetical protein